MLDLGICWGKEFQMTDCPVQARVKESSVIHEGRVPSSPLSMHLTTSILFHPLHEVRHGCRSTDTLYDCSLTGADLTMTHAT